MTHFDNVHRAICRESCAFRGEPPCWQISDEWPNPHCDEPGCEALAKAAVAAAPPEAQGEYDVLVQRLMYDESACLEDLGPPAAAALAALQAENARLRNGGCARDQTTTQFCAEAEAAQARIAELEGERDAEKARVEAMITRDATGDNTIIDNYFALGEEFGWTPNATGAAMSPFDHILDWKANAQARIAELEAALTILIGACDAGRRHERGIGGMTIQAQLERTVINGVPAIAVEDARDVLLSRAALAKGER
jgi:hypothetical protein